MRVFVLLLALALSACDSSTETRPAAAVYVGNRGGTVTRFDPATGASDEAFAGFGAPIRSVVESGRRLYVLTAGAEADSGRVVEIDLETGARVRETGVLRPRRLAIRDGVGYVTNERTFSVTPVRLATGRTEPPVQVGDAPEGVAVVDGRVYVASWNRGLARDVRIVSALTQTVAGTDDILDVCDGPRDLHVDNEGEVWVFCTGRLATAEAPATNGAVVVLDGRTVVARFDLDAPLGTPGGHDAAFRPATGEAIVAVGRTLVRFDTRANTRGETVEIAGAAESPVSAVAIDEASGDVYLGRLAASDPFGAPGFVSVHGPSGAERRRFDAGVFPVAVVFERR